MWDPSILWHDGKYYAFMMYNKDGRNGLGAGHCLLATSTDGVHWEDQGAIIDERGRPDGASFFKCFVAKCGDKFIMDHGVARQQGQDLMRFYQSKDLRHWDYITSTEPDDRWYRGTAGTTCTCCPRKRASRRQAIGGMWWPCRNKGSIFLP